MSKLKVQGDERLVCPKPRRAGVRVPDFLEPLACMHSHSQEGSREIIDMLSSKGGGGQESISSSCSPSCYCGSPPRRANNPLVHDVQFIHQMELLSPFARTNLSDRLGMGSTSPA
ncbi:hypothetical protein MRB53_001060 [Persea americana]|uniref:Uncharacterized protein n=1 Tax=Persea americana TaxID=3435 RepID=A0ACC2MQL2_PERAE|nr:hypothetical protein MRB53_001060 [Persea americana]